MSSDKGRRAAAPAQRHRHRNFTEEVYGARLPFEDARILDDYAQANGLDRSEVVRLGLHQFALRQQMRYHKKDPLRESLEQVVAEQLAPVLRRTDELTALLNDLAVLFVESGQSLNGRTTAGDDGEASQQIGAVGVAAPAARVLAETKQLLEQTLMAVMLGLRLQVNFLVEPVVSLCEGRQSGEEEKHLRAAILGRDLWSETTRKVFARTGKRLLFESNLITREEWEELLEGYRAEDEQGSPR